MFLLHGLYNVVAEEMNKQRSSLILKKEQSKGRVRKYSYSSINVR